MTAVVKAESLTKRFGEVSAVTDLSFALEAGTITGFLGPNGAAKTTTMRMVLSLVAPTSGRALVFDHPHAELPGAALRISSHVLAEVAQTVDRVLIIRRGRLVLASSLPEPTARAGAAVRVRRGDPPRLTTALRDDDLQVTTGTDHALLVQGASSEPVGEIAFPAGLPLVELVNDRGVLEDIFLELTSEAPA